MKDLPITMDEPANWMEKTGGYAKDMMLRDYFAAKAMPSILNPNPVTGQYALVTDFEDCAIIAYKMADAMLKARDA